MVADLWQPQTLAVRKSRNQKTFVQAKQEIIHVVFCLLLVFDCVKQVAFSGTGRFSGVEADNMGQHNIGLYYL